MLCDMIILQSNKLIEEKIKCGSQKMSSDISMPRGATEQEYSCSGIAFEHHMYALEEFGE